MEGILIDTDKGDRLVVSINLLQRSVAVKLDRDWVHAVADAPSPRVMTMSRAAGSSS